VPLVDKRNRYSTPLVAAALCHQASASKKQSVSQLVSVKVMSAPTYQWESTLERLSLTVPSMVEPITQTQLKQKRLLFSSLTRPLECKPQSFINSFSPQIKTF